MSSLDSDFLMPAMHAAHRIGVDGECNVLMDAAIGPEDPRCVRIAALVCTDTFDDPHLPFARLLFLDRHLIRRPAIVARVLRSAPTSDVMRTRNDARTHSFRHP